jgi:hypothetical protein
MRLRYKVLANKYIDSAIATERAWFLRQHLPERV